MRFQTPTSAAISFQRFYKKADHLLIDNLTDLKFVPRKRVRVRIPPSAPFHLLRFASRLETSSSTLAYPMRGR